ncbi:MAG TPA: DGQHR domain-containing protein [Candidatus Saccharimonadales bacterium]|nr:DGQHR domain-containing protein [Candidatus Saccharimonadales bacterium]
MANKKPPTRYIEVKASHVKQKGWTLYCFVLDSETFDRIAFVSRRDEDKELGYQRNLSKQRAADIARYLDKENGCIPNSILVSLEPGALYIDKTQTLRIPDEPKAAWVIDGQHRMFGLRQAKTKYDLVVTAFVGLDVTEQAKQFKTINSKQKGVPTSLLYDLLDLTKDGTYVQQRGHELAARLNGDPESPWFGQIDMTGSGDGLISQTRVVTALESLISERGALFQYSEEEQYGILRNYFTSAKGLFPSDWANKNSVLTKALGFSALLTLLPQVLALCLQRFSDFTVSSVTSVMKPMKIYNFSVESHKGWAGHPGQNRLAGALADALKSGLSQGSPKPGLRLA